MNNKKAIVIGSGFGGLAAAIRLRAKGFAVQVCEANDQPGGRAAVFKQDGYTFDAGPTVITAPYLFAELFTLVGKDYRDYFELLPVDPFYRIVFHDGSIFNYVGDEERIHDEIAKFNPGDVQGYRKLVERMQQIFAVGYSKLVDVPFHRPQDMLRVVPEMIRLGNYRSVYSLVASFIQDERLRQVFSFQPLLIGGNPFSSSSIYCLIHWLERKWGVHFARGGTTKIVHALVQLLEELDVPVRLNAAVEHIDIRNHRVQGVRLHTGETLACDTVVCNGDPSVVYQKLIPLRNQSIRTKIDALRMQASMSLFVIYFGTKRKYEHLAHHTILLGPRYKELLSDIFTRKKLADDFSLYLHAPTRTDQSMAPDGHEAFYVLSPVPNNRSGIDWNIQAEEYQQRILNFLDRQYLPGLQENLTTCHSIDPRYFEHQLHSMDGAAFGPEPLLSQSAFFRFHNQDPNIQGLYFVGAGTHPGGGVPGVLNSAKVLDRLIPSLTSSTSMTSNSQPVSSRSKVLVPS